MKRNRENDVSESTKVSKQRTTNSAGLFNTTANWLLSWFVKPSDANKATPFDSLNTVICSSNDKLTMKIRDPESIFSKSVRQEDEVTNPSKNNSVSCPPLIEKFELNEYYYFALGDSLNTSSIAIPTNKGRKLVADYYSNKYNTKMTFPVSKYGPLDATNFCIKIDKFIKEIKKDSKEITEFRQGFIFGGTHALSIMYIKEGNKEAFLYSDSKGEPNNFNIEMLKKSGIEVYATEDVRQADNNSCYTDALIMGRDITALDPKTKQYRIPDILNKIEDRRYEPKKGSQYIPTLLPDGLLKASQITKYTEKHKEKLDPIIHKNETLKQFRKRYTRLETIKGEKKKISSYLLDKGVKFTNIIEMQFYLNQIGKVLGNLSDEDRLAFISLAKVEFKNQGHTHKNSEALYKIAENFINDKLEAKTCTSLRTKKRKL